MMNHGRRGDLIFKDKGDFYAFIDLLKDCVEMWNMRVVAYCLMGNHHISLQTPDANLSRCMRHINGAYTQYFNRTHGLDEQTEVRYLVAVHRFAGSPLWQGSLTGLSMNEG